MSEGPLEGSPFHLLLARLHTDPARAAAEFDRLRRALVRFFDWRGAPDPDSGADEVLDRVARKIGEGAAVEDLAGFALGIARFVLKEGARRESRFTPLEDAGPIPARPPSEPEPGASLADRLDACLRRLDPKDRDLVLSYYAGERGRAKSELRKGLARERGLSENALRSKIQRLRDGIERCIGRLDPGRHGTRDRSTRSGEA